VRVPRPQRPALTEGDQDDALAVALHLAGEELNKALALAQGGTPAEGGVPNGAGAARGRASAGETSTGG
jgi:hypothetical protein